MNFIGKIGRNIIYWGFLVKSWWVLFYLTIKSAFVERKKGKILLRSAIRKQILFTGYQALPVITIIAIFTGVLIGAVIFALYSIEATKNFTPYIQTLFTELTITTFTPLFISLIIIARSGTAIAAEIANMQINKEIKLIESLGINKYYYLILTRIIGMIISLLCLTIYFHFFALFTEYLLIMLLNVKIPLEDTLRALTIQNFSQSLLKMFFIGLSISVISSYFGMSAEKSYTEVPQATTKGVVSSIVVSFILTGFFTVIFALIFGLSFTQQHLF